MRDGAAHPVAGGISPTGRTVIARLDRGCHHHSVRRPELSCHGAEIPQAFPQLRGTVAAAHHLVRVM
jgi:hypothetical protein